MAIREFEKYVCGWHISVGQCWFRMIFASHHELFIPSFLKNNFIAV